MVTPRETEAQIRRAGKALEAMSAYGAREVCAEIDWRLRRRTPVLTGRARGNWRVGLGSADTLTRWEYFDPEGKVSHAEAVRVLRSLKIGTRVYFTNGLHYVPALEDGWSRKAPEGMIRVTVAEIPFICHIVARGMKRMLHFREAQGGEFVNE